MYKCRNDEDKNLPLALSAISNLRGPRWKIRSSTVEFVFHTDPMNLTIYERSGIILSLEKTLMNLLRDPIKPHVKFILVNFGRK